MSTNISCNKHAHATPLFPHCWLTLCGTHISRCFTRAHIFHLLSVYFSVKIFFNYLQIYLHILDDAHHIPMIQFSNAYAADCIALAGRLIDHDDDLTHVILDVTLMENNGVLQV